MRIKSKVDSFIVENPTWVVYIRKDERFPCAYCYLEEAREGEGLCPHCYGTGFKVELEKLPVRHYTRRIERKPDIAQPEGTIGDYRVLMDFRRDDYPAEHDKIVEVEWNVNSDRVYTLGQPVKVFHVYTINTVMPNRERGEVAFYTTSVALSDINKRFYEELLLEYGV